MSIKSTMVIVIGSQGTLPYEFRNIGHKVTPGQVLKLEVISLQANIDVEGFIQAVEVPTTENPTTYTGA